jgi:PTH1 family peptidyl-tRNA hydrolase
MANDDKYLIVGLGNPGREYKENRHNIGFMAVERLAARHHISFGKVQSKGLLGNGRVGETAVILLKPQTCMNSSGDAVGAIARYYKIPAASTLIVYDELDLPFGTLRLRGKGGAGGHNGMRSIIQQLGNDFPRLRLGVDRPPGRMPAAAYVLQNFGKADQPLLNDLLDEAVRAIDTYLHDGIELAMTRHNQQLA